MPANSFVQVALRALKDAGIDGAELLRDRYEPQSFGDAELIFRLESLLLRFIRDRGEEFLELGSTSAPDRFHQWDDVEVAFGWRSTADVLAKTAPEPLADVLARLRGRLGELQGAMSADQERFTRARIERAAETRGRAVLDRLRR